MRSALAPGRLVLALLLVVALGACGGEGGVDRSDPDAVYVGVLEAIDAGDLGRLEALLTERGRVELRRDLAQALTLLQDGEQAPAMLRAIQARAGRVPGPLLERARAGAPEAVFALLVLGEPGPVPAPAEPPPAGRHERLYRDASGTLRRLLLVETPDGWAVEDLQI